MTICSITRTVAGWSFGVVVSVGLMGLSGQVEAATARAVFAGASHTCVITSAGGVKCWGHNSSGQLGDGTTTERWTPAPVSGLSSGVASASAGFSHSCALTTSGGLKCWGYNGYGHLGDGTAATRTTPVDVSGLTSGVAAVEAGYGHTCAVTTGGSVKCWGYNYYGQLGNGATSVQLTPVDVSGLSSGAAAVAAGSYHTCALTTGGGVKCWGRNTNGQLGDGTTTNQSTPVSVSGLTSGVAAIAAGGSHTCALTTGGGLKCWGGNSLGQVGDTTYADRPTPVNVSGLATGVAAVTAGDSFACALLTAGSIKCWGYNSNGQLGDGTSGSIRNTPAQVSGLTAGQAALTAGSSHACAVTDGGGLHCWGSNIRGQLGNGTATTRTTPTAVLGLTSGAAAVAGGDSHSCALTTAGGVKCWGGNQNGEVGDGTTTARSTPTDVSGLTSNVASIASGWSHVCALTTAGGLKCWGKNGDGRVGDGTTTQRSTPVDVSGLTNGVAAVATGAYHTCALTAAGGVKCWGQNGGGQLGDGTTASHSTPADVLGLTSGVAAVGAGAFHSCAVMSTGALKCWGFNNEGQLGDGTTTSRSTPTDVSTMSSGVVLAAGGSYHTCALVSGGAVKCWGSNSNGQLGDGTQTMRLTPVAVSLAATTMASVTAGQDHTCGLTTTGGVKCWGSNSLGDLGDGSLSDRTTPVDTVGLASGMAAVAAGYNHACAVTTGGAAVCWGNDERGQLGDASEPPPLVPVKTIGLGHADFDADDIADIAVYRPSTGTWFSVDSSAGNTAMRYRGWGVNAWGDTPVVGDFDGDGVLDPTVFRPGTGTWFILLSKAGFTTWTWFGWGNATDTLVPGDYDGDGKTDGAVYRASTGTWYVKPSSGATQWNLAFGNATDQPIAGDFDGDGRRDLAVYRASTGTWFWLTSSSNYTTMEYKGWGVNAQGDTPAPGDYDGDGKTDLCVFRPGTGTWYVLQSSSGFASMRFFGWGTTGDTVAPGDYDGDGITDGAIYRASTFTWYIRPSSGATQWSKIFGQSGDLPLVTIR